MINQTQFINNKDMQKELRIFNTLKRKKMVFTPINAQNIRVYACGPTVYNYAHVGNARMAVVCDLLIKILKSIYKKVTYVSNITDIDDKIIEKANKENVPVKNITEKFLKIYNHDMDELGVSHPSIQPKATEHISEMILIIEKLIKNNNAYVSKNHVLFHVPSYKHYGSLSRRSIEEQIAGSRIEIAPFKKYDGDFVLWKPSKKDEPKWSSPWGEGRPGWHLECSAMSEKCLGLPFDIHAGGIDLTFPHHENEIAQSCSLTQNSEPKSFARYWFHNGFVMSNGEKMSKSIGNIKLIHDLLKEHSGETIRFALLATHYRQPLNWNNEILDQSRNNLNRFYRFLNGLSKIEIDNVSLKDIPSNFLEALLDDLNTPKAISILFQLINIKFGNNLEEKRKVKKQILSCGKIFGLFQNNPSDWFGYNSVKKDSNDINKIIANRNIARKKKNFELADTLRNQLKEMGIEIEDNKSGTTWRKIKKN